MTCHVYSVHAAKPSSGEALWSLNHQQDRGLYAQVSSHRRRLPPPPPASCLLPRAQRRQAPGPRAALLSHHRPACCAQLGRETNCLIDNRWSAVKCRQAVLRKGGRKLQQQPT